MKSTRWMWALVALVSGCGSAEVTVESPVPNPADTGELRRHVQFLAAPELEGRSTPSTGLEIAARYIETHLRSWGLEGVGADGSFRERVPLVRVRIDSASTWMQVGDRRRSLGDGFQAMLTPGEATGSLVYVGHGWRDPARGLDPFAEVDVRGKIVLALEGHPDGFDPRSRADDATGPIDPYGYAQEAGAVGFIMLPRFRGRSYWSVLGRSHTRNGARGLAFRHDPDGPPTRYFPYDGPGGSLLRRPIEGGNRIPAIVADTALARDLLDGTPLLAGLLGGAGESVDAVLDLPDRRVSLTTKVRADTMWIENIVARIAGHDPDLRDEHVVLGAHYDHLGGDKLGADDNASGAAGLLAIAKAISRGDRPARSVAFMWFAGEESGLWGSEWAVRFSSVPAEDISAFLNLDMIGRSAGPRGSHPSHEWTTSASEVLVIGATRSGASLRSAAERADEMSPGIGYTFVEDEVWWATASDHAPFAEAEVPSLWFFTGFHDDYHGAGDTWEKIDYEKLEAITRSVALLALNLAGSGPP